MGTVATHSQRTVGAPGPHRPQPARRIPTDSDLAAAVSVLARAHQDAVRERGRLVRRLRWQLREYYPAALEAFKDLSIRTAVTILSAAPTPTLAAQLSHDDILQLARSCGHWGISHREVTRLTPCCTVISCGSRPWSKPRWGRR